VNRSGFDELPTTNDFVLFLSPLFSIKVDKTVLFESQVKEKRQRERKKGGDVHVDI
jgi:hypothetical protein